MRNTPASQQLPWWRELLSIGCNAQRSMVGRFTEICGYGYILIGLPGCVDPEIPRMLLMMEPFQTPRETGLFRLFGLLAFFIGWLYVLAGRSESRPLILGTLVDRWLVPPIVMYLYVLGQLDLWFAVAFSVGDTLMVITATILWFIPSKRTS